MLTPLSLQKIELSPAYTAVYLGTEDHRFVIFLPPHSGKHLQHLISKTPIERPWSFDVIQSLIVGSDLNPTQVIIDDEKEGVFFTKIFLEKKHPHLKEILEIDARPSESLALALAHQLPLLIPTDLLARLNNLSEIV